MDFSLANAGPPVDTNATIMFVFVCFLLMGVVFALAVVPVWLAGRRDSRGAGNVKGLVIVWALLAWGTAVYALRTQEQWTETYNQRIMSGYFDAADPDTTKDAPSEPWIAWGGVAAGYATLLGWSAIPRR